ncbi:MAG: YceI family protein [Myxococcales bacterium]|nr:YceI family protein [Myxococcales bacterium]
MTPVTGRIEALTFKDGFLSKVAHDLLIDLPHFELTTDGTAVEGRFVLTSLTVVGVMRDGSLDARGISERDRQDISGNIQKKILHTREHPEARFSGTAKRNGERFEVRGGLRLLGETRELSFDVREVDGHWQGEVELQPTRWGIQPFKALLGAIKLQDRVVVRFDLGAVKTDP